MCEMYRMYTLYIIDSKVLDHTNNKICFDNTNFTKLALFNLGEVVVEQLYNSQHTDTLFSV